jgi:hypothetical protein
MLHAHAPAATAAPSRPAAADAPWRRGRGGLPRWTDARFLYKGSGRTMPEDSVVSASLLNAKAAVGGIGVEPRTGGVLRVLWTSASDIVADTVVRGRHRLRYIDPTGSTAVFDVLSDREEAQHKALWPAFLAAKAAGKRPQFHRARLVIYGERVAAPVR